jgi:hypothetical protein
MQAGQSADVHSVQSRRTHTSPSPQACCAGSSGVPVAPSRETESPVADAVCVGVGVCPCGIFGCCYRWKPKPAVAHVQQLILRACVLRPMKRLLFGFFFGLEDESENNITILRVTISELQWCGYCILNSNTAAILSWKIAS